MLAGMKMADSGGHPQKVETSLTNINYSGRQVEEIIRFLETKYIGEVNTDEMVNRAIKAVLEGLDPHTHYFPPDEMEALDERTSGHYVGIGIEVAFLGDSLVILYPKKDSPAQQAGLKPGDYILSVDGKELLKDSLSQTEILELIKGSKGTKVKLGIKPMLANEEKIVEVTRGQIEVPSVVAAYMIDSTVAYIKVQRFTGKTYREFMDAWERMATQENAVDLIIDLRDNPGGYLKESVNILSQIFEEQGKLLVYTQGTNQRRIDYESTGKIFFPIGNVAVLINEGSASASEIIAGCLQDHDRAVIIGERSYGKGLVQEQYELSNGGVLRMTVSKYYTPSGRSIQRAYDDTSIIDTAAIFRTTSGRPVYAGGGITPDIIVKDDIDWMNPAQVEWMDLLSTYAIRYNLMKHDGEILPVSQMDDIKRSLPDSNTVYQNLLSLSNKRNVDDSVNLPKYLKENKHAMLRIAMATLIAYRTGEEGWYVSYNESDPVLHKAREVVKLDREDVLKPQ